MSLSTRRHHAYARGIRYFRARHFNFVLSVRPDELRAGQVSQYLEVELRTI